MKVAVSAGHFLFFAMVLNGSSGVPEPVRFERVACCATGFSFEEVARVSGRLARDRGSVYRIVELMQGRASELLFVGATHEGRKMCLDRALIMREKISKAYLVQSPLGAALHYWNHSRQEYRSKVLYGQDLFAIPLGGGQLAWIQYFGPERVMALAVADQLPTLDEAKRLTARIAKLLNRASLLVYVRTDPYYWPLGQCLRYVPPIVWQRPVPAGVAEVSPTTVFCRFPFVDGEINCSSGNSDD